VVATCICRATRCLVLEIARRVSIYLSRGELALGILSTIRKISQLRIYQSTSKASRLSSRSREWRGSGRTISLSQFKTEINAIDHVNFSGAVHSVRLTPGFFASLVPLKDMYHRISLSRKSDKTESLNALVMTAVDASHHRIILIPPNPGKIHQSATAPFAFSFPFPRYPNNSSNSSTVSPGLATQAVVHAFLYPTSDDRQLHEHTALKSLPPRDINWSPTCNVFPPQISGSSPVKL